MSNVEEKKLQGIVDEIMIDIEEENFDEAYIKAKSLHYTSGWSDEIESKWDETRKALIEEIEDAEKEKKGNNSFFNWFN